MTEPASPRPFRVCQSCGSLTPAGDARCVQCGATSPELAAAQAEAMRESQFARAFFSRGAPFTWFFLGANFAVYLLVCFAGGPDQDPAVLTGFGAKVGARIAAGEYWRLVTPIFIHAGPLHLLVNSYGLYALGPAVEKLYGSPKFVFLYLGSGVASILASYRFPWLGQDVPSVGASGALFGLIGVLTVFGFKYRDELPGHFKKAFGARLIPVILINLVIGLFLPVIDNSAHIGGLIAGGILASFVPYHPMGRRGSRRVWQAVMALCLLAVVFSFGKAWAGYAGPPLSARRFDLGLFWRMPQYLEALNEASKSFARAFNRQDPAAADSGLEALRRGPTPRPEFEELRRRMLDILGRLKAELQAAQAQRRPPDAHKLGALRCERDRWIEDYKRVGQGSGFGWHDDPEEQLVPEPRCLGEQKAEGAKP